MDDLIGKLPVKIIYKETKLMASKNLEELLDALVLLKEKDVQDVGLVELPTFGGEEPASVTSVWSWDSERLLVGASLELLRIVPRNPS